MGESGPGSVVRSRPNGVASSLLEVRAKRRNDCGRADQDVDVGLGTASTPVQQTAEPAVAPTRSATYDLSTQMISIERRITQSQSANLSDTAPRPPLGVGRQDVGVDPFGQRQAEPIGK